MIKLIKSIFSKDFCASCVSLQKENEELRRREKELLKHIEDIKNHDGLPYCCRCGKQRVEYHGEWCKNCQISLALGPR